MATSIWQMAILLSTYIAGSYACPLPTADNVDWTKLSGNWYESFHSDDPIMSRAVSCFVLGNFSATADYGCKMDAKEYYYDGRAPVIFQTEVKWKQNGVYHLTESAEIEAIARHEGTKTDPDIVREDACGIYERDIAYFTDYQTFLILVTCAPGGGYVVWGKTPTPDPTYDKLLPAINALVDAGISCRLYKSECSNVADI